MMKKVNFLEGSISKEMILFAIPIFLGNLFQQLYNAVDSLIVGNFLGTHSLAAVTSTSFSHLIAGVLRGAGRATVPMYVIMCFWCIFRVTYITITIHYLPMIQVVFWAYPITWTISSIIFLIYYKKVDWVHKK